MTRSMTGFASRTGRHEGWSWTWDVRSVNGRGLDIRLRLPDGIEGLEAAARQAVQDRVARGNVTLSLKLQGGSEGDGARLDEASLARVVGWLRRVSEVSEQAGLTVAPASTAEILAFRGVLETDGGDVDTKALRSALLTDLAGLLDDFDTMREDEGRALAGLLSERLTAIRSLHAAALDLEPERAERARVAMSEALARIVDDAKGAEPERVAQELAMLAVKSDVAEELDRIKAHLDAADTLLAEDGPKGRKFDFLTQEFNREANTLCSKAGFAPLTKIGLDMKHAIDQMREQVQNLE